MAAKKKPRDPIRAPDRIDPLIVRVRGQRVVLDSDLARLYGVTTGAFNQAFKRNAERFPDDFAFQLTRSESSVLRSQSVTSRFRLFDSQTKSRNRSQTVISPRRSRGYLPWAFTEHGALMAANVLRSEHAAQMSVFVIRAFVRMREQVAANTAILKRLAEIDQSLLEHDTALRDTRRRLNSTS